MWQGFESGNIEQPLQSAKQACVWQQFPELNQDDGELSLQLSDYLLVGPQKYYSRDAFREVHDWLMPRLQKPSDVLLNSLFSDIGTINQAIREMREINKDPQHDQVMPSSDVGLQQLCRDFVLPRYLNLAEAVYLVLIEPIAVTMTIERGKKPDGIQNNNHTATTDPSFTSVMPATAAAYDSIVRNAIAHNGVEFTGSTIRFTDRGSNSTKSIEVLAGSAVRLFDYAVDVCNALVLAFSIVLIGNRKVLSSSGHTLPDELLTGALIAKVSARTWSVTGCEEAPAIDHQSQLVVKVQEDERVQSDFLFKLHRTAAWAQTLLPGYARYFVQTSSPAGNPTGLHSFDGSRLDKANNAPCDSPELHALSVNEEPSMDFSKRHDWPKPIRQLWLLGAAAKSQFARTRLLRYAQSGRILLVIRNARAKRDHSTIRLWAWAVPSFEQPPNDFSTLISSQPEHVLRELTRASLRVASRHPAVTIAPKYVCLNLFSRDLRTRELEASHLRPELICQLEYAESDTFFPRVTLLNGTVERRGQIRITWNSHPVPYAKESWFC
jgi:hypothetical protein